MTMIYDDDFRSAVERYRRLAAFVAIGIFAIAFVYFTALFLLARA